ncbi:NAD(P)H-dependent glycerol-3-phosphate dehydrogenase [Citreimonas salinaria]|uniref:NAD(P)H-dependent glycerol-3-phosphate dehydrogenase n=1 Tax=Citreimonas salinaria TaxID=321339 RepID=UPI002481AC65|nr:NAD(P)H-dependent glycerol-3-phosphate dehydrogenase [Citreimonas salinaria]
MSDLSLTCSSESARNMSLGLQLGRGLAREAVSVAVPWSSRASANAQSVTDLSRRLGVMQPICETVRAVLHDGAGFGQSFAALRQGRSRPSRG